MSNDPNDRFMISDLSSKLSAYINGEQSRQVSQTRDPSDIEDVFASEIKPGNSGRKLPGDALFTDLDQALDSRPDGYEEKGIKQRFSEEQRQRAEDVRRQQLRNEQLRQQRFQEEQKRLIEEQQRQLRLREEQLRLREEQQRQLTLREEQLRQQEEQQRQLRLQEEQQRQLRLQEEQLRQLKLRREKALARSLTESLYSFDIDQTFISVRSGHTAHFSKLSPTVKSMPSEAALKKALAKMASADKAQQSEMSYDTPQTSISYETPESYEAPAESNYVSPQTDNAFEAPTSEQAYDFSNKETADISQPSGESRYAKSPDPTYKGYQEERKSSPITIIITLLIAFLAVAAIFIIIRRYSSNLTNLLNGTPAAGTTETVSKAESEVESDTEKESGESEYTDSNPQENTQETINNMAINEEGEIFHADSQAVETGVPGEQIPEDPNDITYLASVNEKAAADAIAELSEAAPRLYLSTYGIKLNAGDSFNALAYVERIEDDSDTRERLFRDISIDGLGEFDAKVQGTYELIYFCYDSSGNRSNRAKLTVIVE